MKKIALCLFLVTAPISLIAGLVFMGSTLSTKQLVNTKIVPYKHPCIVLKVDNSGCQADIEMRTYVVKALRLPR